MDWMGLKKAHFVLQKPQLIRVDLCVTHESAIVADESFEFAA